MTRFRSLGVAAMFLVGCAVGGASSRFVVPSASAQQAAALTKWEYVCKEFPAKDWPDLTADANGMGNQNWELAVGFGQGWCFKRPKM